MFRKLSGAFVIVASVLWSAQWLKGSDPNLKPQFHTSDRCFACHNELTTPNGQDVSIGLDVAIQHHGEFGARSLLAGERAP